jgi:hypothetical protein
MAWQRGSIENGKHENKVTAELLKGIEGVSGEKRRNAAAAKNYQAAMAKNGGVGDIGDQHR